MELFDLLAQTREKVLAVEILLEFQGPNTGDWIPRDLPYHLVPALPWSMWLASTCSTVPVEAS
jgi:hypothetical protein